MKTKNIIKILLCWLTVVNLHAQTCDGITFTPPSAPSTCTYSYVAPGIWVNSLGAPVSAPNNISSGQSVCILTDNSTTNLGNIKGTLYIAPGVTYTGSVTSIGSGGIINVEGIVNFTNSPGFSSGALTFVHPTGEIHIPGNYIPGGDAEVHNAGLLTIGGNISLGGNTLLINYSDSKVIVQGDVNTNSIFKNCGILEVVTGTLYGGGASTLENYCTTYVHQDMNLSGDFQNDGLLIVYGQINYTSNILYNSDTIVFDNLVLNGDSIVGNGENSLLIVQNNAELQGGAAVTGHAFFDVDDGGGFDFVCATCIDDIMEVNILSYPSTIADLTYDCGTNIVVEPIVDEALIDFDGVDDYLSGVPIIQDSGEVTLMAWIKLKAKSGVTDRTIVGEDVSCRLYRKHGNGLAFGIRLASGDTNVLSGSSIINDEWHHIVGSFSGTTGTQKLYIDGNIAASVTNAAWIGQTIEADASLWNGKFEIGRLSRSGMSIQHFSGSIDEIRVFNKALTDIQIQQMVYQEIENNLGNVRGKVIPKDIKDYTTLATVPWNNLLAYYPMTNIVNTKTTDFSGNGNHATLHNITSILDQTAPMPYQSSTDGLWTTESTWLHGDVWDIEDVSNNKDWSIVHVKDDITASHAVKNIGLFIDANKTLVINGDNQVENSWYLELNGTLDLQDDSQLIQTTTSDLVTSADGKILRRQEGTASPYWYNYWSSPVGAKGTISLSNNNAATNNANNSDFSLNMLKDDSGFNIPFTGAYTASGNISTYWLYTFINGITYWDWAFLPTTTGLKPGVGYTQKGTGTAAPEQQYIYEGKPNNGTILIDVEDVGGPGSVPNDSKTEYLLGNPYASALDIHKFIDDNVGVIDGYLQLWQQWGGTSHNLNQYQGGYAQVNKTGSIRAYQFVSFYGANNGSQDGTIIPTRYLPVGQGFITEIVADGQIEFNNSQRVFVKESDADGTYNNGSTFSRSTKGKSTKGKASKTAATETPMQKIRLEFSSTSGPATRHELLLGFSDQTTDAFDFGYDAKNTEAKNDDLNLDLDGQNMNIQAYAPISADKVVPLNFRSSGDHSFEIRASEIKDIKANQAIYLRDNLTGTYFDLTKKNKAYSFSSVQGVFNDRFEIVFQSEQQSLSTDEALASENFIYFKNTSNTLYVKKLNRDVSNLSLVNMRGQVVMEMADVARTSLENGLQFSNISTGAYVVWIKTDAGEVLTKKIIVK